MRLPEIPPSNTPWNTRKIQNSYFGGIFLVFSGYRSIQNQYPRIFPEFIRRGVIYYAGNFLPQTIYVELVMRGNSVSPYVDRLFWG